METVVDINPKYKGDVLCVALTKFNGMYGVAGDINRDALNARLKKDQDSFGSGYEVLAVYPRITADGANKIKDAAERLERGEEIDVHKILLE